ncbi:MAG TPA: DUF1232 domain-containing protein [Thermomicrobiales bacterium]|jgi:uncharacterized membrane protein YkvA (DUF1232 family)|nr:DUF1232 domain-containing protein [Thermomicrobiales bacterium]
MGDRNRTVTATDGGGPVATAGLGRTLTMFLPLVWGLFRDRNVPLWKKLATVGLPVLYVLFPIDVVPDFVPLAGRIDDGGITVAALLLFLRSIPRPLIESTLMSRLRLGSRQARAVSAAVHDPRRTALILVVGTILLAVILTVLTVWLLVAIFN